MPSIFLFSSCARIKCNTFTYISNVWIYQCHYHFLMLPSCYHTHHHRHCAKIYRYNKTEKANVISIDLMVFRCCGIRSIRTSKVSAAITKKKPLSKWSSYVWPRQFLTHLIFLAGAVFLIAQTLSLHLSHSSFSAPNFNSTWCLGYKRERARELANVSQVSVLFSSTPMTYRLQMYF